MLHLSCDPNTAIRKQFALELRDRSFSRRLGISLATTHHDSRSGAHKKGSVPKICCKAGYVEDIPQVRSRSWMPKPFVTGSRMCPS